jgi:gamma-glutamyl-gamma-aminobutyrate hydrolase PuuD
LIAITQRVDIIAGQNERRDALDQRWSTFCRQAGIRPLLIPNDPDLAAALAHEREMTGLILTGGNSLVAYGGDAPERDETELLLLRHAIVHHRPVIGVCRGMQLIQHHYGEKLRRLSGHAGREVEIEIEGRRRTVNSYHEWGTRLSDDHSDRLTVFARADDGVVKGIRHVALPLFGIMWHPERFMPFQDEDITLFRSHFRV